MDSWVATGWILSKSSLIGVQVMNSSLGPGPYNALSDPWEQFFTLKWHSLNK